MGDDADFAVKFKGSLSLLDDATADKKRVLAPLIDVRIV